MLYGGGWVGATVAKALIQAGLDVKLIEPDRKRCDILARDNPKAVVLHGEGTDDILLKSEHAADMDAFVACSTDSDSNILSALLARRLGCPFVGALTDKQAFVPLLTSIGVNFTISPRLLAVGSILQYILQGRVTAVAPFGEDDAEAIEFIVPSDAPIAGKTLKDADLPSDSLITAVARDDQLLIPIGETVIQPGDRVVVFALLSAVPHIDRAFSSRTKK
jgi:trk system potassium uptake protein TrkA